MISWQTCQAINKQILKDLSTESIIFCPFQGGKQIVERELQWHKGETFAYSLTISVIVFIEETGNII